MSFLYRDESIYLVNVSCGQHYTSYGCVHMSVHIMSQHGPILVYEDMATSSKLDNKQITTLLSTPAQLAVRSLLMRSPTNLTSHTEVDCGCLVSKQTHRRLYIFPTDKANICYYLPGYIGAPPGIACILFEGLTAGYP